MQENTPAVLWLYTQDLKSFVSQGSAATKMELCGLWAVIISNGDLKRSTSIAQNAGCTMAIHAICTKLKIRIFFK
ncbi:hypothetical protein ACI77J_21695 [Pseudomonas sp. O64]|uniref:hypothetical protein n=1 Tax=unclassified Pseudomonas TaxID=196821 RepID=UPI0021D917FC|nr:hypothetical protein [Pseudomonas sp. YeP6b]UXZ21042.1 hypothetical protein KZH41_21460 [Pseudomonas sp. YeP6b]